MTLLPGHYNKLHQLFTSIFHLTQVNLTCHQSLHFQDNWAVHTCPAVCTAEWSLPWLKIVAAVQQIEGS